MAEKTTTKKTRRLRAAPQTMRERATSTANKPAKQSKLSLVGSKLRVVLVVFRPLKRLSFIGSWRVWKPFKVVGRLLAKVLVPRYVRNSFHELRKVTWPDRKQTFRLTAAVILFSVIFGTVVAVFDYGLDKLFKQVLLR